MNKKIVGFLICCILIATVTVKTDGKMTTKIVGLESETDIIETIGALAPELSYDPKSHDFGEKYEDEVDTTTFDIWNSGCCHLTYRLIEYCSWVEVYPYSGSSSGEHDTITVTIDTSGLSAGIHHCSIFINTTVGSEIFNVYVIIKDVTRPVLTFFPRDYTFNEMLKGEVDSTNFEIWNCGIGTLNYSLNYSCGWMDLSPINDSSSGEHDTITVTIDTSGLNPGNYKCDITINCDLGDEIFKVYLIVVPSTPLISFFPQYYRFMNTLEGLTYSTTFEIWNSGVSYLSYSFIENCSWVDIYPLSGYSYGEHDVITVNVNTTGLTSGSYRCNISIVTNDRNRTFELYLILDGGYFDITVAEAWVFLNDTSNGLQIPIDVRTDSEWAHEHIDTQYPENPRHHCVCEWYDETILQEFISLYEGEKIVLYCLSGSRSAEAANLLVENEFSGTIYNMIGGLTAWKDMAYPTIGNQPPDTPIITGPTNGRAGKEYQYNFVTIDIDSDDVYYVVNWSDKTEEIIIGPYVSGEEVNLSHTWDERDSYIIKVKAKDIYNANSEWAMLEISMSKNKAYFYLFMFFMDRLVDRFQIMEWILQPVYDKMLEVQLLG